MALKVLTNLGYSTIGNTWGYMTNKELAKHDLLLNLNITTGECDWDPDLGTSIQKKMFNKKTQANKDEIVYEIQKVFNDDPRFTLEEMRSIDVDKGWIFYCTISYLGGTPEEWIFSVNREGKASVGNFPVKD